MDPGAVDVPGVSSRPRGERKSSTFPRVLVSQIMEFYAFTCLLSLLLGKKNWCYKICARPSTFDWNSASTTGHLTRFDDHKSWFLHGFTIK